MRVMDAVKETLTDVSKVSPLFARVDDRCLVWMHRSPACQWTSNLTREEGLVTNRPRPQPLTGAESIWRASW